jgi:hypothetical protein
VVQTLRPRRYFLTILACATEVAVGVLLVGASASASLAYAAANHGVQRIKFSLLAVGSGEIAVDGKSCGSACTRYFARRSKVVVTARPTNGSSFRGWSSFRCGSSSTQCEVALTGSENVALSALFSLVKVRISWSLHSRGTVVSTPPGIKCTRDSASGFPGQFPLPCEALFPLGSPVTLNATPLPGAPSFTRWTTAPRGKPSLPLLKRCRPSTTPGLCTLSALWTDIRLPLVVGSSRLDKLQPTPSATSDLTIYPSGDGHVRSQEIEIDCRDKCHREDLPEGKRAVLRETPTSGWRFDRWVAPQNPEVVANCGIHSPTCTIYIGDVTEVQARFKRRRG